MCAIPTKDEVAETLAQSHFRVEPGLRSIYRIRRTEVEASPSEPIKLLEVNEVTVPSGVMPVYFGPHAPSGITFPSVIVDVTPREFDQIRTGELKLPAGWTVEEELHPPAED